MPRPKSKARSKAAKKNLKVGRRNFKSIEAKMKYLRSLRS